MNLSRAVRLFAVGCLLAAPAAAHPGSFGNVRTDNPRIREVLSYAARHSGSFRELLATLELFDRTVYVEEGHCRHHEQHGCLQLMATPPGRNLLVQIDPRQPIEVVVAQLAHELYHAVEVGRAPEVTDAASLRALYQEIGEHACLDESDDCWETRAASAFEALVLRELKSSGK